MQLCFFVSGTELELQSAGLALIQEFMQGVNEWTLSCPLSRLSWSTHREHGYSEQISADSSHYYREYLNVSCQYNPWISTS